MHSSCTKIIAGQWQLHCSESELKDCLLCIPYSLNKLMQKWLKLGLQNVVVRIFRVVQNVSHCQHTGWPKK